MCARKKSGFNTTGVAHTESGNIAKHTLKINMQKGTGVPDIELGKWDHNYLMMLGETAGQSDES